MDPNFQKWKMMQDLHPGAGVWWANMPLPPGWEGKYDHGSKKYFFINHGTRSTQWVDPRKAHYEQQRGGGIAPPQGPRMPQSSPRMPQSSPRMPQSSPRMPQSSPRMPLPGPAIPMQPIAKPRCRTCKINEVPSSNQDCQGCQSKARQREAELVRAREAAEAERQKRENQQRIQREQEQRRVESAARSRSPIKTNTYETSFSTAIERSELTEGQKRAMINNLDEAFPGIERSVVEMVVETSSWDSEKAVSLLSAMSPQKAQPKAAVPKPAASKAPASKAAAPAAPAAPPTAAIKKKMRDYLKKIFPSCSETLIDLALETTQYNQGKACQVLRMTMAETSKPAAKKTTSTDKTTTSGASSSRPTTVTPVISAPAKTSVQAPVSTSISKPSSTSTPSSTSSTRNASFPSTSSPSILKASEVRRQAKTAKATDRTKGRARRTRSAERAPKLDFDSLFSASTKGPDASLVSGPNKANLLDNYVDYKGSDQTIVHGPRKESIMGPSKNNGHDASLATGPQGSHYTGAQANLAKGSMYKSNRQM